MRTAHLTLVSATIVVTCGCGPTVGGRPIATSAAPAAIGAYSQAVQSGATLYVAGQLALDPASGQLISDTSIEAQTHRSLQNLQAILGAARMRLADVVMTQVFLADIEESRRMNEVYATYFPSRQPARIVIEASRLPRNARVEISAIAVRGE